VFLIGDVLTAPVDLDPDPRRTVSPTTSVGPSNSGAVWVTCSTLGHPLGLDRADPSIVVRVIEVAGRNSYIVQQTVVEKENKR